MGRPRRWRRGESGTPGIMVLEREKEGSGDRDGDEDEDEDEDEPSAPTVSKTPIASMWASAARLSLSSSLR